MKIAGFGVTTAYFPLDVDTLNITGSSSLPMIKPTTSPSGIPTTDMRQDWRRMIFLIWRPVVPIVFSSP